MADVHDIKTRSLNVADESDEYQTGIAGTKIFTCTVLLL